MVSYDTLNVYLFIAVISPALAEEVEIRENLRLIFKICVHLLYFGLGFFW